MSKRFVNKYFNQPTNVHLLILYNVHCITTINKLFTNWTYLFTIQLHIRGTPASQNQLCMLNFFESRLSEKNFLLTLVAKVGLNGTHC